MKTRNPKVWNSENLVQFGNALGEGYVPGMGHDAAKATKGWTAQRHLQASALLSHGYNPGL